MTLRLASSLVCLTLVVSAQALPGFVDVLKKSYNLKTDSAIMKAGCVTCHTQPPKRNVFGATVQAKLAGSESLTVEVLKLAEGEDSDADGATNGDELKAGTLPGDPKSKPAVSKGSTEVPASVAVDDKPLVPKHTFHPAVSHFPLALFAMAAVFGFLGQRKNNDAYVKASILNLAAGLLLSILTIGTGIIAMLRLGYAIEGTMLIHLLLASGSTILGIIAYTQREKKGYLPLVMLCGLVVLAAGHFGGEMVYGS